MAADIGKLFNFLKDKEDRPIPLKAQFKFTPENIDWEGLAYDQKELNLIKDTDNLENVVWEKVPQNTENLKWIIRNSPDNVRMSSIDINDSGMISLLGSNEVKVPIEKFKELKIDKYSQLLGLERYFKLEDLNLNDMLDFSKKSVARFFGKLAEKDEQRAKSLIDFSKFDTSDPEIESEIGKFV